MTNISELLSKGYKLPNPTLLDRHNDVTCEQDEACLREASREIEKTLDSFGICGYVSAITVGPRVTRFEIALNPGVRTDKFSKIETNFALALKTQSIRLVIPIPGKNAVGIEVPNKVSNTVYLRSLLESSAWRETAASIPILLGRDIENKPAMLDLAKAPHLLIAGTNGSGKSVCLNSIILSLLFRFSPDELKFIMVDPKVVEMENYRPIPHLITPIVNDPKKAALALHWGVNEMERRYKVLAKVKAKNLAAFNSRPPDRQPILDDRGMSVPQKLPILVFVINELAELMLPKSDARDEMEMNICRLAQKGRAAGIHLIITTQFSKKDVITGLIKANIPTKIVFRVNDNKESCVVLDSSGAEKLLGNGDMLFDPPGGASLERIQGAYVSTPEIAKVIDEIATQRPQTFDDDIFAEVNETADNDTPKGRRTKGKNEKWSRSKNEPNDDVIEIHLVLPEDMRHRVLLYQHVQRTVDADVCDDDGTTSTSLVRVIDKGEGRHIAEANSPILIDLNE